MIRPERRVEFALRGITDVLVPNEKWHECRREMSETSRGAYRAGYVFIKNNIAFVRYHWTPCRVAHELTLDISPPLQDIFDDKFRSLFHEGDAQ